MENTNNSQYHGGRSRSAIVGVIIICAGILLLLRKLGVLIPGWIFTWPMVLIIIGLAIGVKSSFRNMSSVIMILIGGFFLARHEGWIPFGIGQYFWPIAIILVGAFIIIRPKRRYSWTGDNAGNTWQGGGGAENVPEDMLDSVAVFCGVHRNITSKNFKRGEAVNIFGGTDLNFTQADINGTAVLDVVCIFGGIKIIVPADWEVQVNVVHVFGGTDDKRPVQPHTGSKKVLVLTGAAIFGGVEIRS